MDAADIQGLQAEIEALDSAVARLEAALADDPSSRSLALMLQSERKLLRKLRAELFAGGLEYEAQQEVNE